MKSWLRVEIKKLKKHDKKKTQQIHFPFSPNFAPAFAPIILDIFLGHVYKKKKKIDSFNVYRIWSIYKPNILCI